MLLLRLSQIQIPILTHVTPPDRTDEYAATHALALLGQRHSISLPFAEIS